MQTMRKRRQRPDVGQVVDLVLVGEQRPSRDDDSGDHVVMCGTRVAR